MKYIQVGRYMSSPILCNMNSIGWIKISLFNAMYHVNMNTFLAKWLDNWQGCRLQALIFKWTPTPITIHIIHLVSFQQVQMTKAHIVDVPNESITQFTPSTLNYKKFSSLSIVQFSHGLFEFPKIVPFWMRLEVPQRINVKCNLCDLRNLVRM